MLTIENNVFSVKNLEAEKKSINVKNFKMKRKNLILMKEMSSFLTQIYFKEYLAYNWNVMTSKILTLSDLINSDSDSLADENDERHRVPFASEAV